MSRLSPSLILSALLAVAVAPCALQAQAQPQQDQQQAQTAPDQQAAPPAPDQGRWRHRMNPQREIRHMAKMLNLSADQQSRLEPILANRQQQMEALHSDSSLSPDQRHAKMQSIQADTNSQISQVLTDQQNQQWQQMKQQRHQQRQQEQEPQDGPPNQ